MRTKKLFFQIIGLTLSLLLLVGCGSPTPAPTATSEPTDAPTASPVPTVETTQESAPNAAPEAMSNNGTITGIVHLMAPPTPGMVVYALDTFSGSWAYVETMPVGGEAPFSISVQPGTYLVFGAVANDSTTSVGYTTDGVSLAVVTVVAGQETSGINVAPPSQNECGTMMAYPASPDGRFAASPAANVNCSTPAINPTGGYVPVTPEVCGILQELATQSSGLTFTMQPSVPFNEPLTTNTGGACELTAASTGAVITNPTALLNSLKNGFGGWEEYPPFNSNGATGAGIALTRDSALMMVSVSWKPSPDANCPTDQPITMCPLTPEQRLYTITIQAAMK